MINLDSVLKSKDITDKGPYSQSYGFSLVTQMVKNLHAMQETQVPSLGQEDSPGEGNKNPL